MFRALLVFAGAMLAAALAGCGGQSTKAANADLPPNGIGEGPSVGVVKAGTKPIQQQLTVSAELVPFEEIDVYAKESGYVRKLYVDYGSRVKAGQLLAVLEIPELQSLLQQDDAAIKDAGNEVTRAEHELKRDQAQHNVSHLQFQRLDGVAKEHPKLVAQQEVDDAHGKDLAAEAQVDAAQSALDAAKSKLAVVQAKKEHDQVLYDYSKITAPFSGVVTQRFANLGTLMQAGTNSSTQAMPLVRLSQDNLFRLVIPVPEAYVRYIHVGDPVKVRVASLDKSFTGKVARFSVDVKEDTRTMHTEVDVPNTGGQLMAGLYAEAVLTLERKDNALVVPLQAINHEAEKTTLYVVDAEGKIEDRPVKVGLETANEAEITSGLQAGDPVIVSDRSGLKPGQRVHPSVVNVIQYQDSEGQQN